MARAFEVIFALSLLSLVFFINDASARTMLFGDQTLFAPQSLDNGQYRFIMQNDCNLVLYSAGRPVWASQTYGRGGGCRVTLENNGNLALFTASGANIWNSNSRRGPGTYQLIMQDDGNAVIYKSNGGAVWATGTNGKSKEISLTN